MRHAIWSALTGTTLARTCSGLLFAIVILALLGPSLSPWSADEIDWDALESAPDIGHWFGTDMIGRDLFTRAMLGARISLSIAVVATIVSVVIGVPWGALAGYVGESAVSARVRCAQCRA